MAVKEEGTDTKKEKLCRIARTGRCRCRCSDALSLPSLFNNSHEEAERLRGKRAMPNVPVTVDD